MAKANQEDFEPSSHEEFAEDWSPAEGGSELKLEESFEIDNTEGEDR
jgi:hypothetical protein